MQAGHVPAHSGPAVRVAPTKASDDLPGPRRVARLDLHAPRLLPHQISCHPTSPGCAPPPHPPPRWSTATSRRPTCCSRRVRPMVVVGLSCLCMCVCVCARVRVCVYVCVCVGDMGGVGVWGSWMSEEGIAGECTGQHRGAKHVMLAVELATKACCASSARYGRA